MFSRQMTVLAAAGAMLGSAAAQQGASASASTTASTASTSTVSILMPSFMAATVYASVVDVESPSQTVFALGCGPDPRQQELCGIPSPAPLVTAGPSTMEMTVTLNVDSAGPVVVSASCTLKGDVATCVGNYDEDGGKATDTFTDAKTLVQPLRITAGFDKLGAADAEPTESESGESSAASTASVTESVVESVTESVTESPSASASGAEGEDAEGAALSLRTSAAVVVSAVAALGGLFLL